MPVIVDVPQLGGEIEFPDTMSDVDIERAIEGELLAQEQDRVNSNAEQGITLGLHLETLGTELVGNLEQAGIGLAQGFARLSQGANKLLEAGVRSLGEEGSERNTALIDQFSGAAAIAGQSAQELNQLGAETPGSPLARVIAGGVVSSAPSLIAAPAGLIAAAGAATLQQFGTALADFEQRYLDLGSTPEEARLQATLPSLASSLVTGLITAGFGRTGIEALQNIGREAFSGLLNGVLRQAGFEGIEEFTDEAWQNVIEELTVDPTKPPEEVLARTLTAGAAGLVAGGAVTAAASAGTSLTTTTLSAAQTQVQNESLLSPAEATSVLQTSQQSPVIIDALAPVTVEATAAAEAALKEAEATATSPDPATTELETTLTTPTPDSPVFPTRELPPLPATTDLSLGIVPPVSATISESLSQPNPVLNATVAKRTDDLGLFTTLNSPQFLFWHGRLGPDAQAAIERMLLGELEMRENINRDVEFVVEDPLARLPRQWRTQGGEAFFKILDGATIEEINAQPYEQEVKDMALRVKTWLEDARQLILSTRRSNFENYLLGLERTTLQQLYLANEPDPIPGTVEAMSKADLATRLAVTEYPDDWGISDGSYIPHLFTGQWRAVIMPEGDDSTPIFVLRGQTPQEVKVRLREYLRTHPDQASNRFLIEADRSVPADIARLGDKQFFTLLSQFEQKLELTPAQARDATLGVIGRKASKQKYFGSLEQRRGAENYETSYRKALTAYIHGLHRWRVLSRVNNQVQPLIERVAQQGRPQAAKELTEIMEYMWGRPSDLTHRFDNMLQRVPILRDTVKPLALDRWTRALRSGAATAFLTTPRFVVVNGLQPLMGLYPIIGERTFSRALHLRHTEAGRALLDKYGVTADTGAFGEPGLKGKIDKFREKLTGEQRNQELAFLAMYLHGISTGLQPNTAASYAKLRGQIMTQFTPLLSDTPRLLRGPIASTIFQFKRFPIKQLELMATIARDRNIPAIARMFAAFAVFGGLAYFLRSLFTPGDKKLALKRDLEQEFGSTVADLVWFGLPGLANVDLSGSLLLIDQPFGDNLQEKIGRTLLGPAPGAILSLSQAALTEERQPQTLSEKALNLMRRIPALKPIADFVNLTQGNRDVTTADGEVAYRRSFNDMLVSMGAFQSANESEARLVNDAATILEKEIASLKNRLFVAALADRDLTPILKEIDQFNERWPEAAINGKEISTYMKTRMRGVGKTDLERILGKRFQLLMPESQQP